MDLIFSYLYRFLKRYLGVERPLPESAKTLVWMIACFDLIFAITSVFLNIFLFKNKSDWMIPGLYNLVSYPTIMLAFWVGGHLSRRWSHLLSYRLGLFFYALVFLMVLLLRENSQNHPCVLGFFAGLGIGFYYLGQHSLTLDLTENQSRDYFLSLSVFISSIFRILAPALAGWTIQAFRAPSPAGLNLPFLNETADSSTGYYLVFAVVLAVNLVLIYKSFQFKVEPTGERFEFWKVLTFSGNQGWNRLMRGQFILGLRNGVMWFAIPLFVYWVSRNDAVAGSYTMLSNFLNVLTAFALTRWASEKNRGSGMWISSGLIFAACVFLGWRINYFTLLAFAVLNFPGSIWFQVGYSAIFFRGVEKAREAQKHKLEYLAIRELPLMVGRMISLSVFLAAERHFGDLGLRMTILALGVLQTGAFLFLPSKKERESLTLSV